MEKARSAAPGGEDPRVRQSSERTLLAWIRTGLALMGFGFVVARFGVLMRELDLTVPGAAADDSSAPVWVGAALVILGVIVNVIGAVEHARFLRRLDRGEPLRPPRIPWAIVVAFTLAAIGLGITAHLVANAL